MPRDIGRSRTARVRSALAALLLAATAVAVAVAAPPASRASTPAADRLPDRLLTCDLGLALNLDPMREQKRSEVHYEGHHRFVLFLPGIAKRTGPPPDPVNPAEPVDPRTRIVADPDRLAAGVPNRFDRVVDYWPARVEMATNLPDRSFHLVIVSDIDAAKGTAMLFMTHARDVATMDLKHVYSGACKVTAHSR